MNRMSATESAALFSLDFFMVDPPSNRSLKTNLHYWPPGPTASSSTTLPGLNVLSLHRTTERFNLDDAAEVVACVVHEHSYPGRGYRREGERPHHAIVGGNAAVRHGHPLSRPVGIPVLHVEIEQPVNRRSHFRRGDLRVLEVVLQRIHADFVD